MNELRIRPSALKRCAACPGSERLACRVRELLGDPDDTQEASDGTACHSIVARVMTYVTRSGNKAREKIEPIEWALQLAEDIADHDYSHLSRYDRWAVRECIKAAYCEIERHGISPHNVLVEHQMDGTGLGMQKGGTADLVLIVPYERIIIMDWKFGLLGADDADQNDQQAGYAIMGARTFSVREVLVWIVQPKADEENRQSCGRYDAAALKEAEAWVRFVAAKAQDPDAPLVAGYEQCNYCDALPLCPEAKEHIMNAMQAFELVNVPTSPEEWGRLISDAKLAKKWGEKTADLGKFHLLEGGEAEGFKLRGTGKTSTIRDVEEAFTIAEQNGLADVFISACSVRVSELKDTLGHEALESMLGHLIETKEKAPAVVPDRSGK